jgi:hypothetical protein
MLRQLKKKSHISEAQDEKEDELCKLNKRMKCANYSIHYIQ